ncbi:MAG: hypothetical protein GXY14_12880 [Spirochaetes bacterium]|nr:hypothetical protein [Spirochaetota bacterium]
MPARLVLAAIIFLTSYSILSADIIITTDNMVLNGKIIKEGTKTVTFANYHGIFIIDRDKIWEIYRTDNYEDDVKILSDKGRVVNADEVKTNYDSGQKKIEDLEIAEETQKPSAGFNISISPYIIYNFGEPGTILPYSYGVSLTADITMRNFEYLQKIYLSDISVEAGYLFADKGERSVRAYRASAGPQWKFPVLTGSLQLDWFIVAAFGAGWYKVRGIYDRLDAVKWNTGISTGPVFTFSRITFSPRLRFDYIYDSRAPLYGMGAALSFGYRF